MKMRIESFTIRGGILLLWVALASMLTGGVQAQTQTTQNNKDIGAQPALEEIIVTAQKRRENLQDVPIAITAVTAKELAAGNVGDSIDLAVMAPSLSVPSNSGYFLPRLRGVGTSAFGPGIENAVASYLDGVYLAAAPASLLTFNDVDRIEILKGPQGTLFGRNATGGVINVVTKDPTPGFSGNAEVSYGNYDAVLGSAYLTGGSEVLAANLAAQGSTQGTGFGHDFATGSEVNRTVRDVVVRSTILLKPSDNFSARLGFDYENRDGSYPAIRQYSKELPLFGPPTPGNEWDTNNDYSTRSTLRDAGGVSLRITKGLSWGDLVSISAYRKSEFDTEFDYDLTPTPALALANVQKDEQFSQELQLVSNKNGALQWVAGVYYFWADSKWDPSNVFFGGPTINPALPISEISTFGDQTTNSIAGFGQITYAVTAATDITLGLRYTDERRKLDGEQTATLEGGIPIGPIATANEGASFSKLTWRAAVDQHFSDHTMGYVSYNRGFKSGGFNPSVLTEPAFKPELLDAYEVGFKSDFAEQRVRLNPALFYYDYSNIQVPFFTSTGQIGTTNGPSATIYGADMDFEVLLTEQLRLNGGLTYLHDRFGDFPGAIYDYQVPAGGNFATTGNADGNQLPFTSPFTASLAADYTVHAFAGELSFNVNVLYNNGFYSEVDNLRRQDSYELVNAGLTWASPGKGFHIRLWGRNLTNEAVVTQLVAAAQATAASYQPPRTYGVTVGVTF
jgi:iron complex outermembrane receptor protein